jgi:thiosulfate/3-mercaptopyruvate sulfurtransferase
MADLQLHLSKPLIIFGVGGLVMMGAIACSPLIPRSTQPPTPISSPIGTIDPQTLEQRWVVSADEAKQLIQQGATLLDARSRANETLVGAVSVNWRSFAQSDRPNQGKLLTDDTLLTQRVQAIGVSIHQPVVVVGDPTRGWGEDGRIVWMLRTLGHQQAILVDGGYAALAAVGIPTTRQVATAAATPGNFVVHRNETWEIQRDEVRSLLTHAHAHAPVVIIDAREPREFAGATPYGEARGGHIPGAMHLYYRDLLDDNGTLLPRDQILAKLAAAGISADAEIITYCTGGIRSAWLTAVLNDLGLQAKNYAGSMWEWSAAPATEYPLQMKDN